MKVIGILGVIACMAVVFCGCMSPEGGSTESRPTVLDWGNAQLAAADAQDAAWAVASAELKKRPDKRGKIEDLATQMEALSNNALATDAILWALAEPAIGSIDDPSAVVKIVAVRFALRRAGMAPGMITTPERVRTVAGGVGKGLRQALATGK